MLHNDISNRQAPIIAFNVDNLLFIDEPKERSFIDKLKSLVQTDEDKFLSRKVNLNFVNQLNDIWTKHPYSIYLITFTPYSEGIYSVLDKHSVSYTSLIEVTEWEELRSKCNLQYTYYFDSDEELLSYLSCGNALNIKELPHIIK